MVQFYHYGDFMTKFRYLLFSALLLSSSVMASLGEPTPNLKSKVFSQPDGVPLLAVLFDNLTLFMHTSIGTTFALLYLLGFILGFGAFLMLRKGALKKDGGDPEGLKWTWAGGVTMVLAVLILNTTGYIQLMADTMGIGTLVQSRMTLDNTSVQKFGGFQRDGGNGFKDATDAFGVKNKYHQGY